MPPTVPPKTIGTPHNYITADKLYDIQDDLIIILQWGNESVTVTAGINSNDGKMTIMI